MGRSSRSGAFKLRASVNGQEHRDAGFSWRRCYSLALTIRNGMSACLRALPDRFRPRVLRILATAPPLHDIGEVLEQAEQFVMGQPGYLVPLDVVALAPAC
jgi:hypothetical protein